MKKKDRYSSHKEDWVWISIFTLLTLLLIFVIAITVREVIITIKTVREVKDVKIEWIKMPEVEQENVEEIIKYDIVEKEEHLCEAKSSNYNCIGNPRTTFSDQEILELQQIALAEAEVQGIGGMAFVMQVVLNRVNDERFPDTIHDVINQPGQFSTVNVYKSLAPTDNSEKAIDLLEVLNNQGALYFEVNTNESWQSTHLTYLFSCDNHNFYM